MMLIKLITGFIDFIVLSFPSIGCANTCPSVQEIKHGTWDRRFQVYDSDSGEKLSRSRLKDILQAVDQFALAEWSNEHHTGEVHCYYRDKHGSNLEAYFGSSHYQPDNTNKAWYAVTGYMHCAHHASDCVFKNHIVQAAKR